MVESQFTMHLDVIGQELWWLKSTLTPLFLSLKTINIYPPEQWRASWTSQKCLWTKYWCRNSKWNVFVHFFPFKIVIAVDKLDFMRWAVSCTLFTSESSFRALSTRFEPLYTNMYLIGPSDGAVSHYALKLEIYRATSVHISRLEDIRPNPVYLNDYTYGNYAPSTTVSPQKSTEQTNLKNIHRYILRIDYSRS